MDLDGYVRFALALLFVLGLIGLLAMALQRLGGASFASMGLRRGGRRRIEIVEAAAIDSRHRIVLVRRDGREHLILVGANGHLLVESVEAPTPAAAGALAAEERVR